MSVWSAPPSSAATSIATTASPDITLGAGTLTDVATVSGRVNPVAGATIDFRLYGPADATCAGAPVFQSLNVPYPVAGGPVTSAAYTPTQAGTYRWIATYSGDANNASVTGACNAANENVVVSVAAPTIATTASPDITLGGGTLTDVAIVSGRVNPQPGATVAFQLFGPSNPTCTGAPILTSTVAYPVAGGPVTSAPFTPTQAGTYRWIAAYSGDVNNNPVTGACNAANETTVVAAATPTIATTASPDITLGAGTLTDVATVSGRVNPQPGATVAFQLFGPSNPTCTGAPIFTSTVAYPVAGGPVTSAPFTPTQAGTYRWIATYSGDVNNNPVTGACNDANESVVVLQATATISTVASPNATIGSPISDTATVAGVGGVPTPTGTVTFTLFGPNNATCTGAPIFTSAAQPLAGGPPPTASSGPFTPTAVGTYRWIASYSGDANYAPLGPTPCGAPGENVTVNPLTIGLTTQASTNAANVVPGTVVTDLATFTPPLGGPAATGTVTYALVGPNPTANCATPVVGSPSAVAVGSPSGPFTVLAAGTYNFVATYSGDANYAPITTPVGCGVAAEKFTVVDEAPVVTIDKTATPASLPEPGGDFTFAVTVTNTGPVAVTINSLVDDIYGNLATKGTCTTAVGTVLAPTASYSCEFKGPFTGVVGASQTDKVTVTVTDAGGESITRFDTATVTIAPRLTVTKVPNPPSRLEPGGTFAYTVTVTNNGPDALSITELTDSVYGDLNIRNGSSCVGAVATSIAPNGGTYTCQFSGDFIGEPGDSMTDTVTVKASNGVLPVFTATGSATVSIDDSPSSIDVSKVALPFSRVTPGGAFVFQVTVINTSDVDTVTIKTITDDIYGNAVGLLGSAPCSGLINLELKPGEGASCNFVGEFKGNVGDSQTDVVTVTALDDDGNTITGSDDATITITAVVPTTTPTTPTTAPKTTNPPTTPTASTPKSVLPVPQPDVILTPSSASLGDSVIITGTGWNPYEGITATLNSTPVLIAGATAGPTGTFSVIAKIPTDVSLGSHTVVVVGTSGRSVTRPLFVEPADEPRSSAAGNAAGGNAGGISGGAAGGAGTTATTLRTGALVRTGTSALDQVILGGAMLLLGSVAVLATARRFGGVRSRRTPRGRR